MTALGRMWSADKLVPGRMLNVLGAQVVRTIVARAIYNASPVRIDERVRDQARVLKRDGFVVWPDFLSPEAFGKLRQEFLDISANPPEAMRRRAYGSNTMDVAFVSKLTAVAPRTVEYLRDPRLEALLEAAEKRPLGSLAPFATIARLTQGAEDGEDDPQTRLHCDTFFFTHKAWLYLTDVRVEDGPLVFVRGSHRLRVDQLWRVYRESCVPGKAGSRTVSDREVQDSGEPETHVTCTANTLVVANTCGYHRRLRGTPGRQRDVIQVNLRANPFALPFRRFGRQERRHENERLAQND